MQSSLRVRSRRLLTSTVCAVLAAFWMASPAAAATFQHNFDCRGDAPTGAEYFTLQQTTDITAPASVAPGSGFDIVIDPAPNTVPSEVNGYTVERIENIDLRIPVPTNSTFDSVELSGGANLGSTPPTVDVANGIATLHIAGPIGGGEQYELPTITAHLTAGSSGTIETRLDGTGYDDPGLTLNAVVSTLLGSVDVPSNCYPNPNPALTTTTIE